MTTWPTARLVHTVTSLASAVSITMRISSIFYTERPCNGDLHSYLVLEIT